MGELERTEVINPFPAPSLGSKFMEKTLEKLKLEQLVEWGTELVIKVYGEALRKLGEED